MLKFLAFSSIAGALAFTGSGCSSHAYHAEAMQYTELAQGVLIARGMCSNKQDYSSKGLVFFEAGRTSFGFIGWGGVFVNLYDITDAALVDEVTSKFQELHGRLKEPKVTLNVYSSKHSEAKIKFREIVID